MNVNTIGSSTSQSIGAQILQQLQGLGTGTQDTSALDTLLGDQLNLSTASQQLSQAPAAVTQAMTDLLSGQKSVSSDLTQLKSYFQQSPQSLANILTTLQGRSPTAYNASGSLSSSSSSLLAGLLGGNSSGSNAMSLLNIIDGNSSQDPLLSSLGDASSSSNGSLF